MARSNAVAAIAGELFDRDWSRIRGSVPRQRQKQMMRAAMGHAPAIFKAIRDGGTHTRAQFRNQLDYLTSKSSFIIDSRGTYDGQTVLTAKQIEQVTKRFAAQWNEGFHPKLGHTSHLLMAFPIGTRGEDVADITREICERFFQGDGSHFDYIAAVHEDRDHPHAHIVLNRRSKDGEFFYLRRDHHFNYDSFREAMVEVAGRYGLRLEATRRLDRGVVTKAPDDAERRRAKEDGREISERQRVGPELDMALREIAGAARLYRGLAAEATRENQHDIARAMQRAADLLGSGQSIQADGKVYGMAEEQHSFDEVVDAFHDKVAQAERVVQGAAPERRAELERELNDVYQSISHLSPIGSRSHSLMQEASSGGVYSESNIEKAALDGLDQPETRARIEAALKGTGISTQEVVSRIEVGANNAALERQWLSDDLQKIAEADRLDLHRREEFEKAVDRLDEVHAKLGVSLAEARILRDEGAREVERELREPEVDAALPPKATEILSRMHQDPTADPFRNADERQGFREEVADLLGADQTERLGQGQEDVLAERIEDRLDRLYMAKAYLQSDEGTANSVAMERVLDDIADEEVELHRQRHVDADGEKGTTHG